MLDLRQKGQEARKSFTELAKTFQASHPEWKLQQTSQWMNQAQRLRPHFWAYLQRDGQVAEPMLALRLYGEGSDFGISFLFEVINESHILFYYYMKKMHRIAIKQFAFI